MWYGDTMNVPWSPRTSVVEKELTYDGIICSIAYASPPGNPLGRPNKSCTWPTTPVTVSGDPYSIEKMSSGLVSSFEIEKLSFQTVFSEYCPLEITWPAYWAAWFQSFWYRYTLASSAVAAPEVARPTSVPVYDAGSDCAADCRSAMICA